MPRSEIVRNPTKCRLCGSMENYNAAFGMELRHKPGCPLLKKRKEISELLEAEAYDRET